MTGQYLVSCLYYISSLYAASLQIIITAVLFLVEGALGDPGEDFGHRVSSLVLLGFEKRCGTDPVGRELVPKEHVCEEDLADNVDEVDKVREEDPNRPAVVDAGSLHQILGERPDVLMAGLLAQLEPTQPPEQLLHLHIYSVVINLTQTSTCEFLNTFPSSADLYMRCGM